METAACWRWPVGNAASDRVLLIFGACALLAGYREREPSTGVFDRHPERTTPERDSRTPPFESMKAALL